MDQCIVVCVKLEPRGIIGVKVDTSRKTAYMLKRLMELYERIWGIADTVPQNFKGKNYETVAEELHSSYEVV